MWRDEEPQPDDDLRPVFPGAESDVWAWDDVAGQWYLHHFYAHQADLNIANPQVRDEIAKIAEFWLDLGVSGFRLDAAPYITRKASWADPPTTACGTSATCATGVHLRRRRRAARRGRRRGEAVRGVLRRWTGINVMLDFWTNNHLFLAFARSSATDPARPRRAARRAVRGDVRQLGPQPRRARPRGVSPSERDEVLDRSRPDPNAARYGRGIRRRIAPMLDGDRRKIELTHSIVFGCAVSRSSATATRSAWATTWHCPNEPPCARRCSGAPRPPPASPIVRPTSSRSHSSPTDASRRRHVNVLEQRSDPHSLLNAVAALVRARKESPEIGTGRLTVLSSLAADGVLGFRYEGGSDAVTVTLHNLRGEPVAVRATALADVGALAELASDQRYRVARATGDDRGPRPVRLPVVPRSPDPER